MIKIDLGCGPHRREGYIGIDSFDYGQGQEYVLDIEKEKLPFDDDSVDEIFCNHVLEHLWDVKHTLNECWRVLKKDGILDVKVPYGLWRGASSPVHHQIITKCWFNFLSREKTHIYGYKRWKIHLLKRSEIEVVCKLSPYKI